jgi:iron(III) transport system permease protein
MNWFLLQNSLLVAALSTLCAGGLGFSAALWLVTLRARSRYVLLALAIVALALPPFLVTNCWLDLLGDSGALRRWLPLNLYSRAGAVGLLTSLTWPITTVLTLAAWRRLEPAQLECDPALSGWALLRWLLWPLARRAVGLAAILTFVLALNNFAVPVILQVRVFPEEIWLAFTTRLDEEGAWAAAWPMVAAPLLLLALWRRTDIPWPRLEGTPAAGFIRRQLGGGGWWTCGAGTMILLALSVGFPLTQLVASPRTWSELPNLFRAAPDVIWNSFAFAAVSASFGVAAGLATWRLQMGLVLWLAFLVPGILLSRALLGAFNRTLLYGTVAVVVLAFSVRYVALGWSVVAHALRTVDRDLTDAARLDGAAGWSMLRHVHWPQIAPQVGAAWYVTYLLCLWDVETLVLIQPPGGETLALRVFNLLHYGHNAQVNAHCVLLLALALAPLAAWNIGHRMRARTAGHARGARP